MTSIFNYPKKIVVRLIPAPDTLIAVDLRFKMSRKNDFHYLLFFTGEDSAVLFMDDLLECFDQERSAFIMDYVDPRTNFTGVVQGRVLSQNELKRALKAFEMYHKYLSYPENYEEQLKLAVEQEGVMSKYNVEIHFDG